MAQPVNYTAVDLKVKIAELLIECQVRAAREDEMMARIRELEADLEAERETRPPKKKG